MGIVYFISGIDTDCGKTYITGLLAKTIQDTGNSVITQKIIQSGCIGISEDILSHRKTMGIDLLPEDISGITCQYVLPFAASPHLAASLQNVDIVPSKIAETTKELSRKYDYVLVEGVGGLAVPITPEYLVLDYISDNSYPLILVGSSKLGSINHSILSIDACKQRGINLDIFVYNIFPDTLEEIAKDSLKIIKTYLHKKFPEANFITQKELATIF